VTTLFSFDFNSNWYEIDLDLKRPFVSMVVHV